MGPDGRSSEINIIENVLSCQYHYIDIIGIVRLFIHVPSHFRDTLLHTHHLHT
jgi:hypothetical protein